MKRGIALFLTISFGLFGSCILHAEDGPTQLAQANIMDVETPDAASVIAGGMEGRVSLDLRSIDVVDALKYLAMKAGANIIATKNVAGKVTLMVDNVYVRDVFDIMLRSNGLAYAKQGEIYNVMTEEEYRAIFGRRFADIRMVKIFRLKYAIPEQAFTMLDALKSDIGRVLVEPDSGTALVMDTPDRIIEIENAVEKLEQKNTVKVFSLKYAKAKDVEEQLKTQLDAKKVGTIKADERSNQVIVQTLPDRMEGIEKLVEALDAKTKAVLIDTKIIKVKLSDAQSKGIEWEGLTNVGNKMGRLYAGSYPFSVLQASTATWQSRKVFLDANERTTGVGAYPFSGNTASVSASTKVAPGEKLHVGVISTKNDIDALLKYLQTLGKTQILSNPKLSVVNNQEARIHVGERQAYVTTTTTTGQTTTTVSEEVTFVDVGIQLSVTPTINDDGYVTMKVKPEVSSVVSTLTTPSGNKIPIIDSSMAETTVLVKGGSTVIIGGLRKEEKSSSYDQVPYLGKIPIIGFLFKSGSDTTERTELLVMMTPTIVGGDLLTTGNEREIEFKPGKEYADYSEFNDETGPEAKEPQQAPEEMMKPYKEYSPLKEEKEYKPAIAGGADEQD